MRFSGFVFNLLIALAVPTFAFGMEGGCGAGKCSDCHSLNQEEAAKLLTGVDRVLKVEFAEVPGLWAIEAEKDGQKFPLYVDFSKSYVFAGNVIRLSDGQDLTQQRLAKINGGAQAKPTPPSKIDFSRIPLQDAILLGKSDARTKVVVFTDPECPFCKKLHVELKEVVRADPEIAFYIVLYPLIKLHPNSYGIAKTVVCSPNPLELLEASFSGAPVTPSACPTTKIDENLALAQVLGIASTPTLILSDGTVLPGFKKAPDLLKLLGSKVKPPVAMKR